MESTTSATTIHGRTAGSNCGFSDVEPTGTDLASDPDWGFRMVATTVLSDRVFTDHAPPECRVSMPDKISRAV
jgi:hypothetical protein